MTSIRSKISEEQINFLEYHGVSLDLLFDIKGMTKAEYYNIMGRLGKKVGFNAYPCSFLGHTLKNRHGHCIQCNTKHISFIKRTKGFIYMACSKNGRLLKIGFTENIERREESLNRTKYGGEFDWEVFYYVFHKNAAKIERETHSELKHYQIFRTYSHDGYVHDATELFSCTILKAKSELESKFLEFGPKPENECFKFNVADRFEKILK